MALTAVSPRSLSRFLARSMNGARSRNTVSPRTTTPLLLPDSTVTACWCAARIAAFHAEANSGLATSSAILSWTNPVTAEVSVGVSALSRVTSWGGSPWAASAATASSAIPCTSTYWKTVAVSRLVSAFCTSASSTSGLIVRTKRSVSETWLCTQTETPATGASRQPSTISTTATIERPPGFLRGARSARLVATSRRNRSSSSRSSAVSGGAAAGGSSWVMAGSSVFLGCRGTLVAGRSVRHHLSGMRRAPDASGGCGLRGPGPGEGTHEERDAERQDLEPEDQGQDDHGRLRPGQHQDAEDHVDRSGRGEPSPVRDLRAPHECQGDAHRAVDQERQAGQDREGPQGDTRPERGQHTAEEEQAAQDRGRQPPARV